MSKIMNDNFQLNVGNPIDAKYLASTNLPYESVSAVNSAILESQRYVGLTVNVNNVEYWYGAGVTDGSLVIKDSGIASTGITAANNGLTKVGNAVILGGSLTGNTTINLATSDLKFSGDSLQYTGDYSSTYVARSLTDAEYVTGLTSQGITSATNGLTKTGQDIKLGGTTPLSETTNICGATNILNLGTAASKLGALTVNAASTAILTTGITEICPTGALTLAGSAINVNTVATYDGDKSPFTARQIPDAAWVTGQTGALDANNGLTRAGDYISLGGALTGNTTIDAGGYNFQILSGATSMFEIDTVQDDICLATVDGGVCFNMYGAGDCSWEILTPSNSGIQGYPESMYLYGIDAVCGGSASITLDGGNSAVGKVQLNTNTGLCIYMGQNTDAITMGTAGAPSFRLDGDQGCAHICAGAQARLILDHTNGVVWLDGCNQNALCMDTQNVMLCATRSLTLYSYSGATDPSIVINDGSVSNTGVVRLLTTPVDDSNGAILVWDSATKNVGKTTIASIGGLTGATNGLCVTGSDVCLGGALTLETTVCGAGSNSLTFQQINAIDSAYMKFNGQGTLDLKVYSGTTFSAMETGIQIDCGVVDIMTSNAASEFQQMTFDGTSMSVLDEINSKGLVYGGAYRSNFTPLSLVDKCYVDLCASSCAITASNGLTKTAQNITLGGAMTCNTCVTGAFLLGMNMNTVNITGATGGVNICGSSVSLKNLTGANSLICINTSTGVLGTTSVTALGGLTGATNGIGTTGQKVCLGGALVAPTQICGTQLLTLGALNGICMYTAGGCNIEINSKSNGDVMLLSQSGTLSGVDFTNGVGVHLNYNATNNEMLVYDNSANQRGLQYAADYSETFQDHSLVDKYYVDSIATGLNVHAAVAAATTVADGNIVLSGNTGTIDGIAVSAITATNNRILVKEQTLGKFNGIYSASTGNWGRTADYDFTPAGEVANGDLIPVTSGSTRGNSQWILTTNNPIVSGDTLTYSLFAQQFGITDGNGICVTTAGTNRNIAVKLSGSYPGLCFDSTNLELDYTVFDSGLTVTAGQVNVNACATAASGIEIPVRFAVGCDALVVDKADFSYTTASNGLTKVDTNITLGGVLTGATTICIAPSTSLTFTDCRVGGDIVGLQYGDDYGSTFTARSIPDAEWVTGQTGAISANNGLTRAGDYISLGGALTGNTSIGTSNICELDVLANVICLSGGTLITMRTPNASISFQNCIHLNAAYASMSLASGLGSVGGTFTDNTTTKTGIQYAGAYESTFVNASLVTKCYVDACAGLTGVQTASNGLTKTGTVVTLGGALTGTTTINGAQTLRLNISTLDVTGTTNITGAANISGAIDGATTLDILGATTLHGTLAVTGATTLSAKASYLTDLTPFTARQIPDAAWVTGQTSTSGIQTVNNGLTKVGTNAVLGGTLTGNTLICGNNKDMCIGGAGAADLYRFFVYAGGCVGLCSGQNVELNSTQGFITNVGGKYIQIVSGGTINITDCDSAGAVYAADYSTNSGSNPRWIPDAEWVTGQTSTSGIQTACNGLTKTGTEVTLGGTITGSTAITITGLDFEICGSSGTGISIDDAGKTLDLSAGSISPSGIAMSDGYLSLNAGNNSLEISSGSSLYNSSDGVGIQYCADYSSGFVARSIPDAEWVTGQTSTSGVQTAVNGLTKTGTEVKLGGTLTGSTTISGAQTFNLSGLTAFNACATNIGLTGAVCVTGAVNTSSSLNVAGAIDGNSTLDILGATALHSTLNVTGTTTLAGLNASGAIDGNSTLDILGATALHSTLDVTGATAIGGVVTLTSVAAGSVSTDEIMVITSGGVVRKVAADTIGEDNNIYEMSIVTTDVVLTTGSSYVQLINNASSGLTITLPAAPIDGQVFRLKDAGGAALTYPVTIGRNGKLIDGAANDGILNTDGGALELVYNNSLGSWFVFSFVN